MLCRIEWMHFYLFADTYKKHKVKYMLEKKNRKRKCLLIDLERDVRWYVIFWEFSYLCMS